MNPPAPLRILFVEDVPADAELAERELRAGGVVFAASLVETEEDFLAALRTSPPDLIITDYALPRFNGMRALLLAKIHAPDTPVIILTGSINEETAVECVKAGAADYILKNNLTRLPFAIREALQHRKEREERAQAERALRESERKLRSIFSAAPVGIGLVRNRVILEVNDFLLAMTGYRREEMVDREARFLYPAEEDYLYVGREKYRQLAEKGIGTVETRWRRKDGRVIDILLNSAYLDPKTPKRGVTFTALDISERERAGSEREKLREQLHQSQKLEAVGQLAGGMAHDFNNMLQTIIGNTELALRKSPPADPLREYLEDILGAGQHSVNLIRSLLAFARKQAITPRKLDLNEAVAGMLKMLKPMLGEDIELAWEPAPAPAPVKLDPTQLSQVLTNLLANARDAITGVGEIAIRVGEARFDRDWCRRHPEYQVGRWISLEVVDTGRGIDREVLSHIFEPFFTTKEKGRGTGLGLPSVYGIVIQNEGFIVAESEPGRGSAFRVFFPPAPKSPREPDGQDQLGPPPGGTETVLLVEDDPAILNLGQRCLEDLGYTVLAAATPAEALLRAETHPEKIDLLLTDVIMPGMNGPDLQERILHLRPGIRSLFISGFTADVIARRQIPTEEVNFLPKPFTLEQLARATRAALD